MAQTRPGPAGPPSSPPSGSPAGSGALGRLGGAARRNPAALLGAGAVSLVVLVALVRQRGSAGDAAPPSDQLQGYKGGTSTYDSTANDVYNSIEGQIQALWSGLKEISEAKPKQGPTPKPKPKPAPKPKPKPRPKPKPHKPKPPHHHQPPKPHKPKPKPKHHK